MSGSQNWRTETDAGDYFLHQKKQLEVADRRPVIRKASDLVGPGIASGAVRVSDYNDLLATFNGYFSSEPGADNAPTPDEAFVGYTISDSELGGRQVVFGLDSEIEYSRTFVRSPIDPESMAWTSWTYRTQVPSSAQGYAERNSPVSSSTATALYAPDIVTIGEQDCFVRTDAGIKVLRQGIYTGSVQIGDRVGSTVANLWFYRPNGNTTQGLGQLNVPLGPTVHIPFTCWATDGEQGFNVAAYHTHAEIRDLWWRFSCTRIGDAI